MSESDVKEGGQSRPSPRDVGAESARLTSMVKAGG